MLVWNEDQYGAVTAAQISTMTLEEKKRRWGQEREERERESGIGSCLKQCVQLEFFSQLTLWIEDLFQEIDKFYLVYVGFELRFFMMPLSL